MNTDQLAAEAAKQILEIPVLNEYMVHEMSAIIKSAIEKAISDTNRKLVMVYEGASGNRGLCETCDSIAGMLHLAATTRAVHASEQVLYRKCHPSTLGAVYFSGTDESGYFVRVTPSAAHAVESFDHDSYRIGYGHGKSDGLQPEHAIEQDTKRLDWLCMNATDDFLRAIPHYLAQAREYIDAAMSQTKEKE